MGKRIKSSCLCFIIVFDMSTLISAWKSVSYCSKTKKNGNKIYRVEKLPSQFLRRLVFEKQGSQEYKWQEKCITSDSVKNSKQTIEDLKDKIFIE